MSSIAAGNHHSTSFGTPVEKAALLADSPAVKGRKFTNGVLADSGFSESPSLRLTGADDEGYSIWDGDDMTLEMLTDVNEDEVDEDVRMFPHLISLLLAHKYG